MLKEKNITDPQPDLLRDFFSTYELEVPRTYIHIDKRLLMWTIIYLNDNSWVFHESHESYDIIIIWLSKPKQLKREGLWQQLARNRNGGSLNVKQAWDGLRELGAQEAKVERWNTLWKFLEDEDSYEDHLITVHESVTQRKTQRRVTKRHYPGELRQTHGDKEANDFIKRGKYKQETDDMGDIYYVKNYDEDEQARERASSVTGTRSA